MNFGILTINLGETRHAVFVVQYNSLKSSLNVTLNSFYTIQNSL